MADTKRTEGHRLLEAALLNQSMLARKLGCTPQAISRILQGGRPGTLLAAKLHEILGIEGRAWLTADDQKKLNKLK